MAVEEVGGTAGDGGKERITLPAGLLEPEERDKLVSAFRGAMGDAATGEGAAEVLAWAETVLISGCMLHAVLEGDLVPLRTGEGLEFALTEKGARDGGEHLRSLACNYVWESLPDDAGDESDARKAGDVGH